jgi:muramoyltetrapeptide carboxypeptidase
MKKPPAIKPGDTVALVAPASPAKIEELQPGIELLESRGYKVQLGDCCILSEDRKRASDEERAREITDAWLDLQIKAVICARGGYGCSRLLPFLGFEKMARQPKLLVGFSDITVLHIALNKLGLATLHAPMPYSFQKARPQWVTEMFFQALEGTSKIKTPPGANKPQTIHEGIAEGIVVGGCLSLICDSIGTNLGLESLMKKTSDDKTSYILLLEDVDVPTHRVDAMLTHLLNVGIMQRITGIIVGEMTNTHEKYGDFLGMNWKDIVIERLSPLKVPMVLGFPFGHCFEMSSLPMGINAKLDADEGILEYTELGVEI